MREQAIQLVVVFFAALATGGLMVNWIGLSRRALTDFDQPNRLQREGPAATPALSSARRAGGSFFRPFAHAASRGGIELDLTLHFQPACLLSDRKEADNERTRYTRPASIASRRTAQWASISAGLCPV